MTESFVCL